MIVVTVSDNPNNFSGLSRVHRAVIDGLLEAGHEVIPCGWHTYNTRELTMLKYGAKLDWPTYRDIPIRPMPKNENSPLSLFEVANANKADAVITIGDYWDFFYVPAVKSKLDYAFKWIGYFTVEEQTIPDKWLPLLRYPDILASPSEFGKQSLARATGRDNIKLIPYGTDPIFKRAEDKTRTKLRQEKGCEGKVRFITIAQNTLRKNLPVILQTAKLLKNSGGSSRFAFHIHTNINAFDPLERNVYDLRKIAKELDVEDMVSFPSKPTAVFAAPSDEYLVSELQASDYYLCPSFSEGYGLPVVEAMACGLPVLANGTTSLYELLGNAYNVLGWAPRGFLSKGRIQILPPANFTRMPDPSILAEDIQVLTTLGRGREMTEKCERYGKGRTWQKMNELLCESLSGTEKGVVLPVEEL